MPDQPHDPSPLPPSEITTPYREPDQESVTRTEAGASPSQVPTASRLDGAQLGAGFATLPPVGQVGRYAILGEIGRGGMGTVLAARDPLLGRPLAVKMLLAEHRDRPELVRRFLEEAQIHGQLQHPGIAPLYDLGRLPDQRIFFSMKLVQGQTLAARLAARQSPADDLPHLLSIFEQVCQTLAYAHARRVIHRDLKPSNIMVGSFGEVQVMDWGLAKSLASARQDTTHADSAGNPMTQADGTHTLRDSQLSQAGAIMGTPAYMAPEQARGAIDQIDERSDVFGLGAILCVILTGKPPYEGPSQQEVCRLAETASLSAALARLESCQADPELVALARSCLAANPEDRPRDAGIVALAMTDYRAQVQERLQAAELKQAAAQARAAAERKARRLTAALATTVLTLTFVAVGGGLWIQQQRSRTEARQLADRLERQRQNRQAVEEHLQRANLLEARARSSHAVDLAPWKEALAAARQAEQQLAQGEPDPALEQTVKQTLTRLEPEYRDRSMLARLDAARLAKTELKNEDFDLEAAAPAYAAAFRDYGIDVEKLSAQDAAAAIRDRPITAELAAALDDWVLLVNGPQRNRLRKVLQLADPDPWRARLRTALQEHDPDQLTRLSESPAALQLPPSTLYLFGKALAAVRRYDEAGRLLQEAHRRHPRDFWISFQLGEQMLAQPRPDADAAIRYFSAALALRGEHPLLYCSIADALQVKRAYAEAIATYRQALRLQKRFVYAHMNMGIVLARTGRRKEAIEAFHTVLEIDPRLFKAHNNLGNVLADDGKLDEAIAEFHKAIDQNPRYAWAWQNVALALARTGRLDEGIEAARKAVAYDPNLAEAHNSLGALLEQKGKYTEAADAFRQAIAHKPNFGRARIGLALTLHKKGEDRAAIGALQEAVQLGEAGLEDRILLGDLLRKEQVMGQALVVYQQACEGNPKQGLPHRRLGSLMLDLGMTSEARAVLGIAVEIDPGSAKSHADLARAWQAEGNLEAALKESRRAVELAPNDVDRHFALAGLLFQCGWLDEAIAEYRHILQLEPRLAPVYNNLANVLGANGRRDEAIEAYRRALELNASLDGAAISLARALLDKGDVEGAIRTCKAFLERKPDHAHAYCLLGQALQEKAAYGEALSALRRGHELGSRQPGWPIPSAAMIQNCERRQRLHDKLPAVLQGQAPPLDGEDRIEYAVLCYNCEKLNVGAARLFRTAFADNPALTSDTQRPRRYMAACAAVRASLGEGKDAGDLEQEERVRWRKQALEWLQADLADWKRRLLREPGISRAVSDEMHQWRYAAALEPVRQPAALSRLPRAEQEGWRKLWADVVSLHEQTQPRRRGALRSPSPLGGEGLGVRGLSLQGEPPHPRPLSPEGRGEEELSCSSASRWGRA